MGLSKSFYFAVASRFCFSFAVQAQAIIMGWQLYELTRKPLDLGLVGLFEAIPALSLALFAGYWVDRYNPKKIFLGVLGVSFLSISVALTAKDSNQIFLAAIITGFARSFSGPSIQTLIPRLIPREKLNEASAWTTSAIKLSSILGPALGGTLLGVFGTNVAYGFSLVILTIGFIFNLLIEYSHEPKLSERPKFFEGLQFVLKHKLLLSALSLDMFAVFFGGVVAVLPIYAKEILNVGPTGLGFLRSSASIGAIIMSIYLIKNPITKNAGTLLIRSVLGFGVCVIVFALSKNFILSCIALALSGALDSISMVIRAAIVQLCSPEEMRGRISAVNYFFIGSSNELGALESGTAAHLLGIVPSVVFGGCMTIVTVLTTLKLVPEIKKLDLDKI